MNYNTLANDLLFKISENISWENWPYKQSTKPYNCETDMKRIIYADFQKGQCRPLKSVSIPRDYVKLDILEKVHALGLSSLINTMGNPIPTTHTIGEAIKEILRKRQIVDFITEEDWGGDLYFTIDAIYVSQQDYQSKIQPKIIKVAEKQLKEAHKRELEMTAESKPKKRKGSQI